MKNSKKENASVNHKKVKKQLLISVSTRNIYFHMKKGLEGYIAKC